MIEYEYLCEAITAWKEGRRPEPLQAAPGLDDDVEPLDDAVYEYSDDAAQPEPAYDESTPQAGGAGGDGYDPGVPAEVPSSGTEPIVAPAEAAGPTEGWEHPQDGPEIAEYGADAGPELYVEGEPGTAPVLQPDLAAAEPIAQEAAAVELDDLEEVDVSEDDDEDEDEDEDEDDFERDYDLEETDDQAGFDFANDLAGYFRGEMTIEQAWEDKATRLSTLAEYGVRDEAHYYQVKATLERYVVSDEAESQYGGLDAIMQIQANARMDQTRGEMQARAEGELSGELQPVEGISLEQWAHAQAALAGGAEASPIIAELGIDQAHWDRVSAEWNARMSRDTTATIATAYGQAFSGAGQGQFAGAAGETAGAMGVGGDVGDEPPVSLDRYVEIMVAQSAGAEQGRDANEILAQQFGINAMEWGQIGGWWGQRIARHGMEDGGALINEFNELQTKYEAQYATGDADEDVEF
ncbi:MAG: hypothetical protein JKY37_27505 [Nannocystaceae bacterium]|nr:hypothetical protein [Nannocystaceae bacterium]